MSTTQVSLIRARAPNVAFNSILHLVGAGGVIYPLPNGVPPGGPNPGWTVNNLRTLGLPPGVQFHVRVTTNAGAQNTSSRVLTFNSAAAPGANFTIGGDAGYPTITFVSANANEAE